MGSDPGRGSEEPSDDDGEGLEPRAGIGLGSCGEYSLCCRRGLAESPVVGKLLASDGAGMEMGLDLASDEVRKPDLGPVRPTGGSASADAGGNEEGPRGPSVLNAEDRPPEAAEVVAVGARFRAANERGMFDRLGGRGEGGGVGRGGGALR